MSTKYNEYFLLTPGPLSTSDSVKEVMLKDWCTWDDDYNLEVVQKIRKGLVALAGADTDYTAVLMQGSGTASVESVLGSVMDENSKLLVVDNGAYGARIAEITGYLKIPTQVIELGEQGVPDAQAIDALLAADASITHVAMVHCETTTGMLNPLEAVTKVVKQKGRIMIVDAMSSFGGIPIDVQGLGIDFLISSANKCIQGVPGFGLVIARKQALEECQGRARSLALDLYAQWKCMEDNHGKWRFTSPTHTVRAFDQAMSELDQEGGVAKRHQRYIKNQTILVEGMQALGFKCLLDRSLHSPIITSFLSPNHKDYQFKTFYEKLKEQGFVIYPGKVSNADCFRIGTIGHVFPQDIEQLIVAVEKAMYWQRA
ncbi:2-aminoethylphosphonate--pyruvate transaminase [Marinomonas rhizomae]|uniref:2-aminoethylphosphonate--pyruvate transaminase n=1 Tax=Marinomonas rhizomae TaxID=491948 RepID=A0A366IZ99_9GAMM|nr:2-aminoethylphosphonate--pyruvate transaminase [Marinomonas rhizomae]RBP79038.1 2-aminoethylphosphonate--pyruvate transaminase [Marinomonas rhizomae]RNF71272.1 2-aminoethylphosphonate--pyruvate transaminase [Marinomonas rhizomae]